MDCIRLRARNRHARAATSWARTYTAPVSDTTKSTVEAKPTERPTPPRTINLAIAAVGAQVVLSLIRSVLLWAYTGNLKQSVIDANKAKSAKDQQNLCGSTHAKGCLDVAHQVQVSLIELTVGSLLITVAILMCARKIRQGVRSGRTLFIVVSVVGSFIGFAGSPLTVLALGEGGPVPLLVFSGLAGLASLAVIVLLYLPESTKFFPQTERRSGSARGLGGLFAPRPRAQRKPLPASGLRSSAASRAAPRASAKGGVGAVRAKGRADEAAVARGAALARSRAKASKSRRTEL